MHDSKHHIHANQSKVYVSTRDRMIVGWEQTMELARNFKRNSFIEEGTPAGNLFAEIAEMQGICAARLHDSLKLYDRDGVGFEFGKYDEK